MVHGRRRGYQACTDTGALARQRLHDVDQTIDTVSFEGGVITGTSEFDIVKMGIGRTFQNPTVFDDLSVVENVDLAGSFRMGLRKLFRQRKSVTPQVAEALELIGMTEMADLREEGVI